VSEYVTKPGDLKMSLSIGIDLGTSNSSAAVALGRDKVITMRSGHGSTTPLKRVSALPLSSAKQFPSYVLYDRNGIRKSVGQEAREALPLNPESVIWGVKRFVGLSYPSAVRRGELDRFKYVIEKGPGDSILMRVGEERYTSTQILEEILRQIKAQAENQNVNPLPGGVFNRAVISVPAYFKAIRTAPIIDAAVRAGFEEVDTIAEPTAAAISYGLNIDEEAVILAYDLGAGTLDVSLIQIVSDGQDLIPGEMSTSGHESLGGIDMDDVLMAYVVDKYGLSTKTDLPLGYIRHEVERAKIALSTESETELMFPGAANAKLTRAELEDVIAGLLDRCRVPIRVALGEAMLSADEVDHVIFIGGPTLMPSVRHVVYDELEKLGARPEVLAEIAAIDTQGFPVDPMECVSQGAALKAGKIIEPACMTLPEGLGVSLDSYYLPIIPHNSMYPVKGSKRLTFANPNAKHLSVDLISKLADADNYNATQKAYKYEQLGAFGIAINPDGSLPNVDVSVQISRDKRLTVTLTHTQSGERVTYQNPNLLKGENAPLQEADEPPVWSRGDKEVMRANYDAVQSCWTMKEYESCVSIVMEVWEAVRDYHHVRVQDELTKLLPLINVGTASGLHGVATLENRLREFLDLLRQPDIGLITEETFRRYMNELRKIHS
jgi:molecular chaperone DnaK